MYEKTVLDNGIRILTEKVPGAYSASVGFWVESGSRYEARALNGISHFIEHMLFKGTDRRSALAIAKEIDSVGGALSAFTNQEFSCYCAKVAGNKLLLAVDLLSDMLCNSLFDFDDIEKERRVILQELHRIEDSPEDRIHDLLDEALWRDHPFGQPVLGTSRTVGSFDRSLLLDFFAARYRAGHLVVAAAGDLDHGRLVEAVGTALTNLPSGFAETLPSIPNNPVRQVRILNRKLEQVLVGLGMPAPAQNDSRRFAAQILNSILGSSIGSRLFQKLREERGMVYSVYSCLNSFFDHGALVVHAGMAPDDAAHVVGIILRELMFLKSRLVSAAELQSAKDQLSGQFMLSLENTDARMSRLAKNELYRQDVPAPEAVAAAINQVAAEDILELGKELFRDEVLVLQMMGNISGDAFSLMDLTLG